MKLFNLILLFFFSVVFQMVAQEVYITPTKEFEPNQKVYLFGNDVKLREEPNTSSKVISLLKISTEVFVIEKTNKIKLYNGIDWPWYKIKTSNGEEGFLLGGLISKEIKKNVIITRGEKGAIAVNLNEIIECSAIPNLKIKDLTGAGDLFAAGYLHGLINNLSIKESLIKGTELSSQIIQKIGARI